MSFDSPTFVLIRLTILAVLFAIPAVVAAAAAAVVLRRRERATGSLLVRTNVRGIEVPVILGDALVGGALVGAAVLLVLLLGVKARAFETVAVVVVMVVMWSAGAWDDRKGDERPRGFRGHLGALGSRNVTGGVFKIVAGLVAGAVASPLLPARGASPFAHVVETVLLVALSANLINLLDRAPGRAVKAALLIGIPLAALGGWFLPVAPVFGALMYCLVPDLRERAMLGDAGANPLGAVLGVGLVATMDEPVRLFAIAVLLALNLASEKWSFSIAIEASPPLRWLDGLGRKDQVAAK